MKQLITPLFAIVFLLYSCSGVKIEEEFQVGLKHYSNKEYLKAIESFDKIINKTDTVMDAFLYRGYSFRSIYETEKAKQDFTVLTKSKSNFDICNGLANRGNIWYDERNYVNALNDYKKSLEYCSDKALILNMITHMFFATNQKDSGCIYYNKSISIAKTEFNLEIPGYCDSIYSVK